MAPATDAAISLLSGQLRDMQSRLAQLERNQRSGYNLQNSTIRGSLTVTDSNGNPTVVVGQQGDGTFTTQAVSPAVPPQPPSTPVVAPGINGLYVAWDGTMSDGTLPLSDFSAMQVHFSTSSGFTPSSSTLAGHMVGGGVFGIGALAPGTTYYVVLAELNDAGNLGAASNQAQGIPTSVPANIPGGAVSAAMVQSGSLTTAQLAANAAIIGGQIANGTLTAANIFAGTITAALLVAGITVSGIVDATTVNAAQYTATGTMGQFLAYSGTPGAGNLINSIAGSAGSDSFGNSWPEGLFSQQLTLQNQSGSPPSFSGAGSFYSSIANRPRYLSSVGTDSVLERSVVNVSSWPMGNTSTPTVISAPISYLANEGTQSSEYEIEIVGTGTWGTTAGVLTFWIYINSTQNATCPIGAAAFTTGHTFAYRIIGTVSIESSTTAHMDLTALLSDTTGNRLSSTGIVGIADVDGNTFTVASNQTIQLYAAVASPSVAFGLNTYRTRLTRRM